MNILLRLGKLLCLFLSFIGIIGGCKDVGKEEVNVEPLIPSAGSYTGSPEKNMSNSEIERISNPLHKSLIYSKWKFEEFDVDFIASDKVLIKGGVVKKVSPEGIVAEYKVYDDGVIEIMVMGMIKTGMWDGKKLVIDGLVGTKIG